MKTNPQSSKSWWPALRLGPLLLALLLTGCPFASNFDFSLQPPVIVGRAQQIALDAAGNRFVAGKSGGRGDYNPRVGIDVEGGGLPYTFITRFDANGQYRWTQVFGTPVTFTPTATTEVTAIVAGNDRVYVAGRFVGEAVRPDSPTKYQGGFGNAFVLALDATTGAFVPQFNGDGVVVMGGFGDDGATSLALSPDGVALYVGGVAFTPPGSVFAMPGGRNYRPPAGRPGFVAALDALTGQPRAFGIDVDGDLREEGVQPIVGKVEALAVSGTRVFVMRSFSLNGVPAAGVLALNANTGFPEPGFGNAGAVEFSGSSAQAYGRSLAVAPNGQTIYALGVFSGSGAGLGGGGTLAATIDRYDADDVDPFILALDAQSGEPRQGFGYDTSGDGVGDGVTVLTDPRVNLAAAIVTDPATGALFILANSPNATRDGSSINDNSQDAFVVKLHGGSGLADVSFASNGVQSFGGKGTDVGGGIGIAGNRVHVVGTFDSLDAGVGGRGKIFGNYYPGGFGGDGGFLLELDAATGQPLNAGPRILSLDPAVAQGGGPGFALTVHGVGFTPASVVLWNGDARLTTFGDSNTLTAVIPAGDIADPGSSQLVSVLTTDNDGFDFNDRVSNDVAFDVMGTGTPPAITQLAPWSRPSSSRDFQLTINGTGFEPGAVVRWRGQARPTRFISSTQIIGTISEDDIAVERENPFTPVTATNPGTSASNALEFVIDEPSVGTMSPASVVAGSEGFELTFSGAGFARDAVLFFNYKECPTTVISRTLLRARIPASDVASPGPVVVYARNPGSGDSGRILPDFLVTVGAAPIITTITPSALTDPFFVGPFTLRVNGSNFFGGSAPSFIRWNGEPRATVFVSSTQLEAHLDGVDAAMAGERGAARVTVENGDGLLSNEVLLAVGLPMVTELEPASAPVDSPAFTLTIRGSRFARNAEVIWNYGGAFPPSLPTTYISDTVLTALVSESNLAEAAEFHTIRVAVQNPDTEVLPRSRDEFPEFRIGGPGAAPRPSAASVSLASSKFYSRDRDHDGFVDDLERLLGSSPFSAASVPAGFRAPPRLAAIEPLAPRLKAVRANRRLRIVAGRLPVPANFEPGAQPVYVYTGGKPRAFDLNRRGSSPRGQAEFFSITAASRRTGSAPFVLRLETAHSNDGIFLLFGGTLYSLP